MSWLSLFLRVLILMHRPETMKQSFRDIQTILSQTVVFLLVPELFLLLLTSSSWDFQTFWSCLNPSQRTCWGGGSLDAFQKHIWSSLSLEWTGKSSVPPSATPPIARPFFLRNQPSDETHRTHGINKWKTQLFYFSVFQKWGEKLMENVYWAKLTWLFHF